MRKTNQEMTIKWIKRRGLARLTEGWIFVKQGVKPQPQNVRRFGMARYKFPEQVLCPLGTWAHHSSPYLHIAHITPEKIKIHKQELHVKQFLFMTALHS